MAFVGLGLVVASMRDILTSSAHTLVIVGIVQGASILFRWQLAR